MEPGTNVMVQTPSQWMGTKKGDVLTWEQMLEKKRATGVRLKVSQAVMTSEADLEGPNPNYDWEPKVQVRVNTKGKR